MKMVKGDKGGPIMIKGSIHQEDRTVVNMYEPNIRAFKYIKEKLTELKKK